MAALTENAPGPSLDIRVEDYLDDRLQSTTDLEDLDSLLENVEIQRNQLQSQLDNAVKELEEARRTADDRQGWLIARIDEFQKLQESIDVRVQIAAASDAPSQAIARLQKPMKKLETVELTQKYLCLLQDVEKYRSEARSHLPHNPKAALSPYTRIKQLATTLRGLQGVEALHLVDYVEKVTDSLWDEMKRTMSAELKAVLKARGWPKVDQHSEMDEEWVQCFEKLLDLQIPEVLYTPKVVPLLAFDVMTAIFKSEFRYHFMSDKPTSSPQAMGAHCFPWFLQLIEKWEDFFRDNLGHLLSWKFRDTSASKNMAYIDPVCALITSMLPVMREKVEQVAVEAIKNPAFLSTFISQLMTFDENVRWKFNYDSGDAENGWPGLTNDVLDEHFETWFKAEKDFALERFHEIMASQEARNIDYDYATTGKMKPTFAAVRVTDLLRSVTTQYERLRKFKYKIRFLIGIQLDILDGFHDRLRGSLEAYQSITSTLGRTLHGVTKEELAALEGTGALETLCKVIGSADHIANALQDWSDEEFFIILWEELQTRAAKGSGQGDNITPNITYDDVKSRTSSAVGQETDEGALFDETVEAYRRRGNAAQDLLAAALVESHSKAFRAYTSRVQWATIGEAAEIDDPSQLTITPELDEPLRILNRNFDFLVKAVSSAAFLRAWRIALTKIQDLLWNDVLLRQSFTTLGAAQFLRDGAAVFALIERYIPSGSSRLETLHEGMRLLSLPVEAEEGGMTLKDASDRVFKDNEEARKVLEQLGLTALTPPNARQILQRRVENNENVGW